MTKRILVVEDQEDNRQILRDLLGTSGYELVEVEDGLQAVAAVAKQRPDLILMDIQLPLLDGYEVTRRIKADPALRTIPVIAVTAYATFGVATYGEAEPAAGGEIGPYYLLAPSLQLIEGNLYWHSDQETADVVPSTGLAASTRAYAKIITDVNQLGLKELQRPPAKEVRRPSNSKAVV